jgi:hypothetical protein
VLQRLLDRVMSEKAALAADHAALCNEVPLTILSCCIMHAGVKARSVVAAFRTE